MDFTTILQNSEGHTNRSKTQEQPHTHTYLYANLRFFARLQNWCDKTKQRLKKLLSIMIKKYLFCVNDSRIHLYIYRTHVQYLRGIEHGSHVKSETMYKKHYNIWL